MKLVLVLWVDAVVVVVVGSRYCVGFRVGFSVVYFRFLIVEF